MPGMILKEDIEKVLRNDGINSKDFLKKSGYLLVKGIPMKYN